MAIPAGTTRLTFSGDIGNGLEKWAFSLYFTGYSAEDVAAQQAAGEYTSTAYTDFRTVLLGMMSTADHYNALDWYYYDGGPAATVHSQAVFNRAGTGAKNLPPQTALVLSLRTALATRSGRGRIYLPATAPAISTSYPFAGTTVVNPAADKLAAWLADLQSGGITGVVVSQTRGETHEITRVEVDNTLDTQRRRRNKLVGTRHVATV